MDLELQENMLPIPSHSRKAATSFRPPPPTPPLHPMASVPFMWEEAPGRAKPTHSSNPYKPIGSQGLDPPPRMLGHGHNQKPRYEHDTTYHPVTTTNNGPASLSRSISQKYHWADPIGPKSSKSSSKMLTHGHNQNSYRIPDTTCNPVITNNTGLACSGRSISHRYPIGPKSNRSDLDLGLDKNGPSKKNLSKDQKKTQYLAGSHNQKSYRESGATYYPIKTTDNGPARLGRSVSQKHHWANPIGPKSSRNGHDLGLDENGPKNEKKAQYRAISHTHKSHRKSDATYYPITNGPTRSGRSISQRYHWANPMGPKGSRNGHDMGLDGNGPKDKMKAQYGASSCRWASDKLDYDNGVDIKVKLMKLKRSKKSLFEITYKTSRLFERIYESFRQMVMRRPKSRRS